MLRHSLPLAIVLVVVAAPPAASVTESDAPTVETRRAAADLLLRMLDTRPEVPEETDGLPEHLEPCHARFSELRDAQYEPRTVVVTLPDPLDSPFRRELDAFLLSVVQAMGQLRFVSDLECDSWRGDAPGDHPDRHHREPGVLLFRRDEPPPDRRQRDDEPSPDKGQRADEPSTDEGDRVVATLLVVGETPGGGVHQPAMDRALRLAEEQFSAAGSGSDLSILGPTFSGSARSLASAVRKWAERRLANDREGADPPHLRVTIRSGSATNTGLDQLFETAIEGRSDKADSEDLSEDPPVEVDFRAIPASNAQLQSCVWNHLVPTRLDLRTHWQPPGGSRVFPQGHPCAPDAPQAGTDENNDNARVALLVESSAYGRQFVGTGFHVIPYSPYIGALRAAHERRRREAGSGGGERDAVELAASDTLPLELDRVLGGRAAFDLEATVISQDVVLTALLEELGRRRTEVVGIIATNTLDKLFLAERLARYTPDARIITFEGDVLLAHPAQRGTTSGMIVASSQPLREPDPFAHGRQSVQRRFDFDASQGLYQATVELLGTRPERPARHVWFTVVGERGFHHLERIVLPTPTPESQSSATGDTPPTTGEAGEEQPTLADLTGEPWTSGRLPRGWWLALTLVSLALGVAVYKGAGEWRSGHSIFGIVPGDLVRLSRCRGRRPDASQRTLHALVAVVPTVLAVPYLLLALPVVVGAAHRTAQAGLQSLPHFFTLDGAVLLLASACFMALLLASTYLLTGLLWRTTGDARLELEDEAEGRGRRIAACLLPMAFAVAVSALAAAVTAYWIPRTWGDRENGTLLIERALALGSGLSPVLPSLLIAAVPVGWIVLSLYRHRVSRDLPMPTELAEVEGRTGHRFRERIEQLRQAIDPGALWQGAGASWVLLVVIPLVFLSLFYGLPADWPLRGMEGWVFDLTTSVLFTLALVMVVASGISLLRGSAALRKLLDSIKVLTSRLGGAEDRDAGSNGRVSLRQAYATARDSRENARGDRTAAWKALEAAMSRVKSEDAQGPPKLLAQRLDHDVVQRSPASALVAVARWLEDDRAHSGLPGGKTADEGAAGGKSADEDAQPSPGEELVRCARNFFNWSTACFLRDARAQLVHLMAFMTAGLIVLLFAVSVYPFEPRRVVILYLGVLITLGAALSCTVVIQLERDRLMRSLSGDDGQSSWRQLVGRLALYAGVPMGSLLASRFPGVRDVFATWVEPLFKALM